MAVYHAAYSWAVASEICKIPRTELGEGFTIYVIEVHVPPFTWYVKHRYSDFYELHEVLTTKFRVDKDLLPPKKLFGNQSGSFILKRQADLQLYLQTLIHQFDVLPVPLANFLDFPKYEIGTIVEDLSEKLFYQGDQILEENQEYQFTLLELHAISERLKLAQPTCVSGNKKQDLGHLLDFVSQLRCLRIIGCYEPIGTSNIVPNNLFFDLTPFKSLVSLRVQCCELQNRLIAAEPLHQTLKSLSVHSSIRDLSAILLCGVLHWSPVSSPNQWPCWKAITKVNFSNNFLTRIHPSVKLLSSVENLDFSFNNIQIIENLEGLTHLSILNMSHNKLSHLDTLHTRLGNVRALYLGENAIANLKGLSRLYSVVELYLNGNHISSLGEVSHLGHLPCLEKLSLENNPINNAVDYRPQVMLAFGVRAVEIVLDGEKPSQKEIDTVAVLQALKVAQGKNVLQNSEIISSKETAVLFKGTTDCQKEACTTTAHTDSNPESWIKSDSASLFRKQVEKLRKLGGNDWLRLLNQMQDMDLSHKVLEAQDLPMSPKAEHLFARNEDVSDTESTYLFSDCATSLEICLPEWLFTLDLNNQSLKRYVQNLMQENIATSPSSEITGEPLSETMLCDSQIKELLWSVLTIQHGVSVSHIPVCILLFSTRLVLLKLEGITNACDLQNIISSLSGFPKMCYLQTLLITNVLGVNIGPRKSYVELQVGSIGGMQLYMFFMPSIFAAEKFIGVLEYYNMACTNKPSPFVQEILVLEEFQPCLGVAEGFIQRQILFCRRVQMSKSSHSCNLGAVHYIVITPSHVLLIGEQLSFTHVSGFDSLIYPSFRICVIVGIRTNIQNIHLKDDSNCINNKTGEDLSKDSTSCKVCSGSPVKCSEELYKCGAWLFMHFDSGVSLCLRFLNSCDRNDFLEIFLCVRSQ